MMIRLVLLLSKLPLGVLYGLSSCLYWILYRFIGYRKSVVRKNLKNSFPELSGKELLAIERTFYRNFFEFTVETLKSFSLSKEELEKRVTMKNPEVLGQFEGKTSIMVMGSHFFNWELMAVAVDNYFPTQAYFTYQKLSNPGFNKLMLQMRSKYGAVGILKHETAQSIRERIGTNAMFCILADQAPIGHARRYWTTFLNQESAFYYGIGQISALTHMPIVVVFSKKIARGRYELHYHLLAPAGHQLTSEEVLERYKEWNEDLIKSNPSAWLWTHDRWKTKFRKGDIKKKE